MVSRSPTTQRLHPCDPAGTSSRCRLDGRDAHLGLGLWDTGEEAEAFMKTSGRGNGVAVTSVSLNGGIGGFGRCGRGPEREIGQVTKLRVVREAQDVLVQLGEGVGRDENSVAVMMCGATQPVVRTERDRARGRPSRRGGRCG
jgi:hypothetical protein